VTPNDFSLNTSFNINCTLFYYSNEKIFDEELELIFNKYFSKYDINMFQTFDLLLINIYNVYILNKIKINEYYSSTYIIKNINIED
jgi:hypothetical protein